MSTSHRTTRLVRSSVLCCLVLLNAAAAYLVAQSQPAPVRSDEPQPTTAPARVASPTPATSQPAIQTGHSATTQPASPAWPTTAPAPVVAESQDPEPPREPSPSEILRRLTDRSNQPPRPVVRPAVPGRTRVRTVNESALPSNAVAPPRRKLLPDGYRIVDRPGRLIRDGDDWAFSFEGRGRGAPELPLRLLPNRLLEVMEVFSAGGTKPVVFIVSGEITEYHNVNYLLVQKLLTRPDLGNLE